MKYYNYIKLRTLTGGIYPALNFNFIETEESIAKWLYFEELPDNYKYLIYILSKMAQDKTQTTAEKIVNMWNKNRKGKIIQMEEKSERSIRIYLESLESHGLIEREKINSKEVGRKKLLYIPTFDTELYLKCFEMNSEDAKIDLLKKKLRLS